jgi:hypothetical protein
MSNECEYPVTGIVTKEVAEAAGVRFDRGHPVDVSAEKVSARLYCGQDHGIGLASGVWLKAIAWLRLEFSEMRA